MRQGKTLSGKCLFKINIYIDIHKYTHSGTPVALLLSEAGYFGPPGRDLHSSGRITMSYRHLPIQLCAPLLLTMACYPAGDQSPDLERSQGTSRGEASPVLVPPLTFYSAEPTVNGVGQVEPLAALSSEDEPTYLVNVDVKFTNTSSKIVALSEVQVSYGGAGAPSSTTYPGMTLVDPWSSQDVVMWGGITWKSSGAGWEDPADFGSGYWSSAVSAYGDIVAAGVSQLEPGGDFLLARFRESGAIDVSRLGFSSATSSQAVDLARQLTAVYALGQAVSNGTTAFALTKVDYLNLEPQADFGNPLKGGTRSGERLFTLGGCQLVKAKAVRVFTSSGDYEPGELTTDPEPIEDETLLYVGGEALCDGQEELIVGRLTAAGDLDTSFGENGVVKFEFPWPDQQIHFAGMAIQDIDGGRLVLAANVGDRCLYNQTVVDGWCQPAITRFTFDGERDLSFGTGGGWALPPLDGAQRLANEGLQVDSEDRIYLGGWAGFLQKDTLRQAWSLSRLTSDGLMDTTWGASNLDGEVGDDLCDVDCYTGRVTFYPGGQTGAILDLKLDNQGNPRAGGFIRRGNGEWDFAAARYNEHGTPQWAATAYGHVATNGASATAYGIAVDSEDRTVLVGSAPGVYLGSARFASDGKLDSELIIRPGESRGLRFPDGRQLPVVPASFTLKLKDGFGQMTTSYTLPLARYQPPGGEGYFFAMDPDQLEPDEYIVLSQHHELGSSHRADNGQRFAYDLHVAQFDADTGDFSTKVPGTHGSENDDLLIWGRELRAVSDGMILECYRTLEDNPAPDERNDVGGGGNMLWVLNDNGDMMLYAHLQQNSMPEHLCPVEGEQVAGYPIVAGEPIGLAGNSGRSGGPHFHTHVQIGHDRLLPGTQNVGLPLLFRDVEVMDLGLNPDDNLWAEVEDQALPPGMFARIY